MPATPSPREVVQRLLDTVTGGRPGDAADLYAEDAYVTHPFQPGDRPLIGRERLAGHFAAGAAVPREMEVRDLVVHETADPEVVIAEFAYHGRALTTGRAFVLPCVFIVRVRDGLIVESRDYAHHLAMAYAMDRVPELVERLSPAER